jgi:hypothetical protein
VDISIVVVLSLVVRIMAFRERIAGTECVGKGVLRRIWELGVGF